jgi:hypothetical protein
MFPNTNTTNTAGQTEKKAKKPGVTFDLVQVTETTDPTTGVVKKDYKNLGTVFVRESMEGGAVFMKQGEGKPDQQLALFRRRYQAKKAA